MNIDYLAKKLDRMSEIRKIALAAFIVGLFVLGYSCYTTTVNQIKTTEKATEIKVVPATFTQAKTVEVAKEEPPQNLEPEPIEAEPMQAVNSEPVQTSSATISNNDPIIYIAKTVYGEARGLGHTDQAAVVWCILNRVDAYGSDIISVVTAPSQFHGYSAGNPVTDDIKWLVTDVVQRWMNEKAGAVDVGRVLPKEYLYFYGSGGRNHFTTGWRGGNTWDWGLASPYGY